MFESRLNKGKVGGYAPIGLDGKISEEFVVKKIDVYISGGTYSNGTTVFTNTTGGTFSVSGFSTGGTNSISGDTYISGITYNNNNILSLYRNDGVVLNTSINTFTGLTINGSLSATTYLGDGSQLTGIINSDTFVSGGTYSAGTAVFTNTTGGTFSVTGFSTDYILTSNGISDSLGYTPLSAYTDTNVTGGTFDVNSGTAVFTDITGGTFSVTGFSTGYTLTSTGITSTLGYTPYNSSNPNGYITGYTDTNVTGGTYSAGTTVFRNTIGGTFSVSGFSTGSTSVSNLKIQNNITFTNVNGDYFGTVVSPITGALTFDTTGAVRGGIAIVYYSNATLNIPSTWITVGTFMPQQLNKLYFERDGEGYVTCNIVASLIDITPPSTIGTLTITDE